MHVVKQYPDGYFSWVDLTTTDLEGAKAFYAGLFGWEYLDIPMPDSDAAYSMAHFDGNLIAGLGPQSPDMAEQGVPPMWASYVKHDNVDAIAAKVTEAGGTLIMPPMDVMESGRMLLAVDPTGAVFGVWQPNQHKGANLVNQPNTLIWNELQTHDVEKAKAFYTSVFGWGSQVDENGYVTFQVEDRTQAGMMQIQAEWGDVPPN
jgi:predicted enzyme related to lactoylglutathione lyase